MRKILFRGKRTDNGEWIEGYYATQSNHACFANELKHQHFIFKDVFLDFNLGGLQKFEVIPETVGQYTGKTDKNGKNIFEGDIVYCKSRLDNAIMVVIFECGQFRMVLSENYRSYQTNSGFYDINCFDKEVIGNIYDNPELLKGGEEE